MRKKLAGEKTENGLAVGILRERQKNKGTEKTKMARHKYFTYCTHMSNSEKETRKQKCLRETETRILGD